MYRSDAKNVELPYIDEALPQAHPPPSSTPPALAGPPAQEGTPKKAITSCPYDA
jgi:hypothetical protein